MSFQESPQRPKPFEVPKRFTIASGKLDDDHRLRLAGELDLATCQELVTALEQARDDGAQNVVVDLRGLSFMDSSGLQCLLRFDAEARSDAFSLELIQGKEQIERLFEMAGLKEHFTFKSD
jgi:anti-sigma B factor antagonist